MGYKTKLPFLKETFFESIYERTINQSPTTARYLELIQLSSGVMVNGLKMSDVAIHKEVLTNHGRITFSTSVVDKNPCLMLMIDANVDVIQFIDDAWLNKQLDMLCQSEPVKAMHIIVYGSGDPVIEVAFTLSGKSTVSMRSHSSKFRNALFGSTDSFSHETINHWVGSKAIGGSDIVVLKNKREQK